MIVPQAETAHVIVRNRGLAKSLDFDQEVARQPAGTMDEMIDESLAIPVKKPGRPIDGMIQEKKKRTLGDRQLRSGGNIRQRKPVVPPRKADGKIDVEVDARQRLGVENKAIEPVAGLVGRSQSERIDVRAFNRNDPVR